MNDLKNGILDVGGVQICADTPKQDLEAKLGSIIRSNLSNGRLSMVSTKNCSIHGVLFESQIFYTDNKFITHITLFPCHQYEGQWSQAKDHELNNQWLREQLGEPDDIDPNHTVYDLTFGRIVAVQDTRDNYGAEISIAFHR